MEKSMLGEAGYMTAVPQKALKGMIDLVKGIEPEIGYGLILKVSEVEANMRESRIRRTKTVCTYCGVGCSFDIWTRLPPNTPKLSYPSMTSFKDCMIVEFSMP
jgi:formate dehydrogenase major subunit